MDKFYGSSPVTLYRCAEGAESFSDMQSKARSSRGSSGIRSLVPSERFKVQGKQGGVKHFDGFWTQPYSPRITNLAPVSVCVAVDNGHPLSLPRFSSPERPIKRPVLDGFRDVFWLNCLPSFKIRDRPGDFQDAIVGARGKPLLGHGAFQQTFAIG